MKMNGSKDMNSQNYHPVLGVQFGGQDFSLYQVLYECFYGCFRYQSMSQPYHALKKFTSH